MEIFGDLAQEHLLRPERKNVLPFIEAHEIQKDESDPLDGNLNTNQITCFSNKNNFSIFIF